MKPFDVNYIEGLKVGYKWFEAENKHPLYAFGYGLSYTTFEYSGLKSANAKQVSFTVKNTGDRPGAEVAQVYLELPATAGEPFKRLVAWQRIELAPGESKNVALTLDPLYLSIFDVKKDGWQMLPGQYKILVGGSSQDTPLYATFDAGAGGIGSSN